MNVKRLIPAPSTVTPILTLLLLGYLIIARFDTHISGSGEAGIDTAHTDHQPEISKIVIADTRADLSEQIAQLDLNQIVGNLIETGQFKIARTRLLEMALSAVAQDDKQKLGNIMLLLGKVATNEMQLDTAEVYLLEALDIARLAGDTMTEASTYQQLGKLHIRSRELARSAGYAHDNLWIVRRQIYIGEYRYAEQNLQAVIEANLILRRFGAAASAYETLASFHGRFQDSYQAQNAGLEAAKLYASSGQLSRAWRVIDGLRDAGTDPSSLALMRAELDQIFQQHQRDNVQSARARDYQMLYHYHKSRGEHERAWKLRILASKSLAETSETSIYLRQPDVMAVLYNSNFAMDKARNYLNLASNLFALQGEDDLYASTQEMRSLIY
jgi:hypothetical protein